MRVLRGVRGHAGVRRLLSRLRDRAARHRFTRRGRHARARV